MKFEVFNSKIEHFSKFLFFYFVTFSWNLLNKWFKLLANSLTKGWIRKRVTTTISNNCQKYGNQKMRANNKCKVMISFSINRFYRGNHFAYWRNSSVRLASLSEQLGAFSRAKVSSRFGACPRWLCWETAESEFETEGPSPKIKF